MSRRSGPSPWRQRRTLRVLVDMDGVLCDFEGWFLKVFRERHPDDPYIPLEDRRGFYVDVQYATLRIDLQEKCHDIIGSEGFFRDLPPIPGAIEAIKDMSGMDGVEVFICTSPLTSNVHSVKEKFEWITQHLGWDWLSRTVITRDKTIITGDILIDDRHKLSGVARPSWDHVLFTAAYNRHLDMSRLRCAHRLDSWLGGQWRKLIDQYKLNL